MRLVADPSSRPTKTATFRKCLFWPENVEDLDRRGGEVGGNAGCGSVGYRGKLPTELVLAGER